MVYRACMRCGSGDVRMPGIRDGVAAGFGVELNSWVCRTCGHKAMALEFDTLGDYEAFRDSRRDVRERYRSGG